MRPPELEPVELCASSPIKRSAVRMLSPRDRDYPLALADLPNPPAELYIVGALETLAPPVVAVVGTRCATDYGLRMTRELGTALARAGACVVSGMARGVDAAAHRAALAEHGRTAAVLGTGVDVPYPVGHRELHAAIGRRGVLISEFPPGSKATKGSFPRRNRILAALASVTIVIEAPVKSGALITAGHALELGRVVAAVPGPIDSPQSAGTNELLRDGANVIATVADALMLAGLSALPRASEMSFGDVEQAVLDQLRRAPCDMDALAARTRVPARECMRAVTALELAGAVECLLTGEIRRR
jgi:DNA processing protein